MFGAFFSESIALNPSKSVEQDVSHMQRFSVWNTTRFQIDLLSPKIMAIVNVTPDSFATRTMSDVASKSGALGCIQNALDHAASQLKAGADLLDIGAESTRPGASLVPLEEEWRRLEPVLREVITWGVPISVDTYKPEIMLRALEMGVDIINDVWALRQSTALEVVSRFACGVCLMHMHDEPQTMQLSPMQGDVVGEVSAFLGERVQACLSKGIGKGRLMLDPGIGFGKTVAQNFTLLRQQHLLHIEHLPLLIGWSRKSSLGAVTGQDVDQRVNSSVVAAVLAMERGAQVIRVHDVAPTIEALKVWLHASYLEPELSARSDQNTPIPTPRGASH
jgi:dihydropteroate synthase